ncbi:MAG: thiamine pyrophosphate-binding protein, partial [Planctomycetota bacterium]|nr:thiamine pyrophosphate-binding protein [Planctomycetota bacterium]
MKTRARDRVTDRSPADTPTVRARRNGQPRRAAPSRNGTLPARMPMGQFLFEYLHRRGVRHSFGVPGDFALPTFAWLEKSKIESITMTHEPGAGFAADAYSRLNGIGLVCVTYCVGGLNVLNAIAGAYAEKSPVVVVSGAPGRTDREKDPLLHHKVKTFETQRRVYDEVTVASATLLDEERAACEIVRCVEACLRHKRPVYIEVPHDMVDREIPIPNLSAPPEAPSDPETLRAALDETIGLLRAAKKPVLLAGVELHRFGLTDLAIKLAESLNIPIAADLLSKSAVAENHPLYLGVYGGAMSSDPHVRSYVEIADCVLMLGTFITDMNMGIYTAKLERNRTILATTESIKVRHHTYEDVLFEDYLRGVARGVSKLSRKKFKHPNPHTDPAPLRKSELTDPLNMAEVMRIVGLHIDENCCVVSDVGDALFGAVGIRTARRAEFIAPAYYLSMGFAVPASIGVAKANKTLRPVVLVGDGAFQMTGTELSTATRLGLKPIVLILNNEGYG